MNSNRYRCNSDRGQICENLTGHVDSSNENVRQINRLCVRNSRPRPSSDGPVFQPVIDLPTRLRHHVGPVDVRAAKFRITNVLVCVEVDTSSPGPQLHPGGLIELRRVAWSASEKKVLPRCSEDWKLGLRNRVLDLSERAEPGLAIRAVFPERVEERGCGSLVDRPNPRLDRVSRLQDVRVVCRWLGHHLGDDEPHVT